MEDKLIQEKVKAAYEYVESLWYEVCYIWLYGSQNYWLDIYTQDYQSDFDFKCVIIPTLRQLVDNSKPVSTTLEYLDGQIDLKDIRVFTETLVKCNPAYLETMYTKYYISTPDYQFILEERDTLLKEMWAFFMKAAYWMIKEKEKAFSHPYPTIKHKIDKYWYDPKQLHHIIRLHYIMERYTSKSEFNMNNISNIKDYLMKIKLWGYELAEAENIKSRYVLWSKELKELYVIDPKFDTKNKILKLSKDLVYNNILKWIN